MPFDPSQFVFQPRPLQQFDFGQGFRDVIAARQGRQRHEEAEAQRADTNSLNAATFARDRNNAEYDAANKKYQEQLKIAADMWAAEQNNQQGVVEGLAPQFQALGGTYTRSEGTGGMPRYLVQPGKAPERAAMDVQGMRSQIYGGGGPTMGQPFQMPSPSGPGGSMLSTAEPFGPRDNPMDPKALPGLSAAAAGPLPGAPPQPPVDTAGPPPGPAVEGVTPPVEGSTPQAPGGQPPQLTGPNPLGTPAFSPYTLNMADVVARNQNQLMPLFDAAAEAAPADFQNPVRGFGANLGRMGMKPEAAMAMAQPMFDQMAGIYRGGLMADAAGARVGATQENAQANRYDRQRDNAFKTGMSILNMDNLKKQKDAVRAADKSFAMLSNAERNPQTANQLINAMHEIGPTGVMSDKDYEHASKGVQSVWQAVKTFTVEKFLKDQGGLDPDVAQNIRDFLQITKEVQRSHIEGVRDRLLSLYRGAQDDSRREGFAESMRSFEEEYWTPEMYNIFGIPDPNGGGGSETPVAPSAGGGSLGVTPLPRTLDGGGAAQPQPQPRRVSPNGTPLGPGRIGPKPPRKITKQVLEEANEDELMRMFKEAGDAP